MLVQSWSKSVGPKMPRPIWSKKKIFYQFWTKFLFFTYFILDQLDPKKLKIFPTNFLSFLSKKNFFYQLWASFLFFACFILYQLGPKNFKIFPTNFWTLLVQTKNFFTSFGLIFYFLHILFRTNLSSWNLKVELGPKKLKIFWTKIEKI